MEFDDFKTWMRATQDSFPSLRQWMLKQPENGKALWKSWRQALSGVGLESATKAIEKMLTKPELQPKFGAWDQLPGLVIGLAGSSAARPKGSKRCICGSDGMVEVTVPHRVLSFDGNELRSRMIDGVMHWGPVAVACLCPVGVWINECRQRKPDKDIGPRLLPIYDPETMVMWRGIDTTFAPQVKIEREESRRKSMRQACIVFEDGMDPGLELPDFAENLAGRMTVPN